VSVVFIQVLHGKTQVWHCIIVSFGIWPEGQDVKH
jgi:hypothetical protein